MGHITESILHLHGWVALAIIFVVPALEAPAFLGFVSPGRSGAAESGDLRRHR